MKTKHPDDSGRQFWSIVVNGFREGPFAEMWFKWMEWSLVTGGIYAVGAAVNSPLVSDVVKGIGWFSGIALMQHAIFKIESTATHLASFVQPQEKWIRWLIIAFLGSASVIVLFMVAYTFQAAVDQSGVLRKRRVVKQHYAQDRQIRICLRRLFNCLVGQWNYHAWVKEPTTQEFTNAIGARPQYGLRSIYAQGFK
jgi:hypothetical protein